MGDNETTEVKATPAPVATTAEKPAVKPDPIKVKKKDKKLVLKPDAAPHLTGRLLQVEIGSSGIEITMKGKKGKQEVFSLKGMNTAAIPAAAALLAGLLESKAKLRVDFTSSGDNRTVHKLRANA